MNSIHAAAVLLICAASAVGSAQTDAASREARIMQHREKIEQIINVNRNVAAADKETSGISFPMTFLQPQEFESTVLPLLKKIPATDAQTERLRETSREVWGLASVRTMADPDKEKLVKLRREQMQILSPAEFRSLLGLYVEHRASVRAQQEAAGDSAPTMQPTPAPRPQ